jgi:hypothetical protein
MDHYSAVLRDEIDQLFEEALVLVMVAAPRLGLNIDQLLRAQELGLIAPALEGFVWRDDYERHLAAPSLLQESLRQHDLLGLTAAADLAGTTTQHLSTLVSAGLIDAQKVEGLPGLRFRRSDIEELSLSVDSLLEGLRESRRQRVVAELYRSRQPSHWRQ